MDLDFTRLSDSEMDEFLQLHSIKWEELNRDEKLSSVKQLFNGLDCIPKQTTSSVYEWYIAERVRLGIPKDSVKYKQTELLALPKSKILEFTKFLNLPLPTDLGYPLTPTLEEFLKDRIIRIFKRLNLVNNDIFSGPHAQLLEENNLKSKSYLGRLIGHVSVKKDQINLNPGDLVNIKRDLAKNKELSIYDGKEYIKCESLPFQFSFPTYPLGFWHTLKDGVWTNQLELNEWIYLDQFKSEILQNLRGPIYQTYLSKEDRLYVDYPETIYRSYIRYSNKVYNLEFMASSMNDVETLLDHDPAPIEYGGHGYFVLGGFEITYLDSED